MALHKVRLNSPSSGGLRSIDAKSIDALGEDVATVIDGMSERNSAKLKRKAK